MLMASASAIYSLYRVLRPFRIGIYGPSMTGKTTLDQYLTVPGDIDPIPLQFRTTHAHADTPTGYAMPRHTRKQVRWKSEKKPISTADIAGQAQFRNLWVEDMVGRNTELVIFMVDHRALTSIQFAMEAVTGLEYLVDGMLGKVGKGVSRKTRKKAKEYRPRLFCLMVNKMDLWWDQEAANLHSLGLLREHPIVYPFRNSLKRLRKAGIRAEVLPISAQQGRNVEMTFIHLLESL